MLLTPRSDKHVLVMIFNHVISDKTIRIYMLVTLSSHAFQMQQIQVYFLLLKHAALPQEKQLQQLTRFCCHLSSFSTLICMPQKRLHGTVNKQYVEQYKIPMWLIQYIHIGYVCFTQETQPPPPPHPSPSPSSYPSIP